MTAIAMARKRIVVTTVGVGRESQVLRRQGLIVSQELWLWVLTGAFGLAGTLFWRNQDAIEKRQDRANEEHSKRAEGLAKELAEVRAEAANMRERMAREYHSKQDLRDLLSEIVAPINRAIEGLQSDFKKVMEKGWPGGGKTG